MKALILLILTACSSIQTCEQLGVAAGHPYPVRQYRPLTLEQLEYACRHLEIPEGDRLCGCTIFYIDGSVQVNWLEGDEWGEAHERCHGENGPDHVG